MDRKNDPLVLILGGGRGARLDPLTRLRSKPAVPIAGKFRLIDIPVSNCIHSGMDRIYVLTQFNSLSLHRHIVQTYQFGAFSGGYVQILAAQQTPGDERWFQGTADAVRQNLHVVHESPGGLTLILSGDHMYRMDYRLMLRDHLEHDAELTVAVMPCGESEVASFGCVRVDEQGRVLEFREKPKDAAARAGMEASPAIRERFGMSADKPYLASMGIYLFRKPVLEACLANDMHDFGHHVIPAAVGRVRVQAHYFGGYWRDIGTIRSFYDAHMDLTRTDAPFDFYDPAWTFYTHPRYLPGSRLNGCRFNRSILADGSLLEECTIEDSVIGVRSAIHRATIRRSLVMGVDLDAPDAPAGAPPIGIGEGSLIQDAIVDKNARIGRNVRLVNRDQVAEGEGDGWVIRDGIIVVAKNSIIPDGVTI